MENLNSENSSDRSPLEMPEVVEASFKDSHNSGDVVTIGDKRERSRTVPFVIIFVLILMIVVGLIVGIIVMKALNNQSNEEDGVETLGGCADLGNAYDVEECIQKTFDEDGNIDERIDNYQLAIKDEIERQDLGLAAEMINIMTNFLVRYNLCEKAFESLDDLNMDVFSSEQQFTIYENAIVAGQDCSEDGVVSKYTGLLNSINMEEYDENKNG